MEIEIKNRWTGAVQVTAEIECDANANHELQLGLAVKWAIAARANLTYADLTGAYLTRANLTYANLTDATWHGVPITRPPIQIHGLMYAVTILDAHMQIGCEMHSIDDWSSFDDQRIAKMDGATARRFWRDWRNALLMIAKADGRFSAPQSADTEAV